MITLVGCEVIAGATFTLNVIFRLLNEVVQFGVALGVVTLVIFKVCPILAAVRFEVVKLAAPETSAITPVTDVCATELMV